MNSIFYLACGLICSLVAGTLCGRYIYTVLSSKQGARNYQSRLGALGLRERKTQISAAEQSSISYKLLIAFARTAQGFGFRDAKHEAYADEVLLRCAGIIDVVKPSSLKPMSYVAAGFFVLVFAVLFVSVSPTFSIIGGLIGGLVGYRWPRHEIAHLAQKRRAACEHALPEMLDIIALCARAGMSFDASVELYWERFDTVLAQECRRAYLGYLQGNQSREEMLKELSSLIDIQSFDRFVESSTQALHFGAPIATVLTELAADIRKEYKNETSEKIAKAPVKMLIPMGVLILPAMLLLVLGPVVLNVFMT